MYCCLGDKMLNTCQYLTGFDKYTTKIAKYMTTLLNDYKILIHDTFLNTLNDLLMNNFLI